MELAHLFDSMISFEIVAQGGKMHVTVGTTLFATKTVMEKALPTYILKPIMFIMLDNVATAWLSW